MIVYLEWNSHRLTYFVATCEQVTSIYRWIYDCKTVLEVFAAHVIPLPVSKLFEQKKLPNCSI